MCTEIILSIIKSFYIILNLVIITLTKENDRDYNHKNRPISLVTNMMIMICSLAETRPSYKSIKPKITLAKTGGKNPAKAIHV